MRHLLPLLLCAGPALAETSVLTVYTYDSFVADWGPGPVLEPLFEATCACDLRLVAAGDGAAMLSRLMLEGSASPADIALGLDTFLMERARDSGLFAPHGVAAPPDVPMAPDPMFLPFDWGVLAFVSRADIPAPSDFRALADGPLQIVIQDPRASTPGLGLALWLRAAHGEAAAGLWRDLADNIVTVTPGWGESYALFLSGEADAVLSYTTSPAYHALAEGDRGKVWWPFAEGHPQQVELAALLAGSERPELARAFLAFLVSAEAQAALPMTNWMFPVRAPDTPLPEEFGREALPPLLPLTPAEAEALREVAVEDWRLGLSG